MDSDRRRRAVGGVALAAILLCPAGASEGDAGGRARGDGATTGAAAGAGQTALALDDVIARHIEARGGRRAWEAAGSIEIKGSMTSWSKAAPFTLVQARGGRYMLDSVQGDRPVKVRCDGAGAWWENHWRLPFPAPVRGADLAAVLREADFPTPFFDWRRRGYDVALLSTASFDDRPAIGLSVKRADGLEETWYLDPGTWLEMGRRSPGSHFGEPAVTTTWYGDFRTVEGLRLPFKVESETHSREIVMHVESVRLNVPVDDRAFAMPAATGMDALEPLAGRWSVRMSDRFHPGAPWLETNGDAAFERALGGALLQERHTTPFGYEAIRSFTYDRVKRCYRVASINEGLALLDVKEGVFDEQKRLVISNEATGTSVRTNHGLLIERLTLSEITPDGFRLERETSTDGGKEWFLASRAIYTRAGN